jgi:NOL1/NOP2/fmu family ribosome biogenesis protein
MQIKKILNSKEAKEIESLLEKNYGSKFRLRDYILIITADDKVWLCSRGLAKVDLKNLRRVNAIGMYFGKLKRNEKVQLSIEGSMLIGKDAEKNVCLIDDVDGWMGGKDVFGKCENCENDNFVIVKHEKDFLGSGILRNDGRIENILPKSRRMV